MSYEIVEVRKDNFQFTTTQGEVYNLSFLDLSFLFDERNICMSSHIFYFTFEVIYENAKVYERNPLHKKDERIGVTIINFLKNHLRRTDAIIVNYYDHDGFGYKRRQLFLKWFENIQLFDSNLLVFNHPQSKLSDLYIRKDNEEFEYLLAFFNGLDI